MYTGKCMYMYVDGCVLLMQKSIIVYMYSYLHV